MRPKAKVILVKLNKKSGLLKKIEKIRNEKCINLGKTKTNKKTIVLLLELILFSQKTKQGQIKTKIEIKIKTFLRSSIVITIKAIIEKIVLRQKTSYSLSNFQVSKYKY